MAHSAACGAHRWRSARRAGGRSGRVGKPCDTWTLEIGPHRAVAAGKPSAWRVVDGEHAEHGEVGSGVDGGVALHAERRVGAGCVCVGGWEAKVVVFEVVVRVVGFG